MLVYESEIGWPAVPDSCVVVSIILDVRVVVIALVTLAWRNITVSFAASHSVSVIFSELLITSQL